MTAPSKAKTSKTSPEPTPEPPAAKADPVDKDLVPKIKILPGRTVAFFPDGELPERGKNPVTVLTALVTFLHDDGATVNLQVIRADGEMFPRQGVPCIDNTVNHSPERLKADGFWAPIVALDGFIQDYWNDRNRKKNIQKRADDKRQAEASIKREIVTKARHPDADIQKLSKEYGVDQSVIKGWVVGGVV